MKNRDINEFFNKEYKEYAKYTVQERAIPSIVDGLKPGARKILHTAIKTLSKGKEVAFDNLVGNTKAMAGYHHAPDTLNGTIIKIASSYRNTLNPLCIIGSGGDLRSPNAASPRYIEVALTENIDLYKEDISLVEYTTEGDKMYEPYYFLPIIPLILTNNTNGTSLGYHFSCMSYNPKQIIEQCIHYLKGNKKIDIEPFVDTFDGTFFYKDYSWYSKGVYTIVNDKIIIDEINHKDSYEEFEKRLNTLKDKCKIIDYEEHDRGKYTVFITVTADTEKIINSIGLIQKVTKDSLFILDENKKIQEFLCIHDVIKYFVSFRKEIYKDRQKYNIKSLEEQLKQDSDIKRFIELYVEGDIELHNKSLTEINRQLKEYSLPKSCIDIKLSKLCKSEIEKLNKNIISIEKEIVYWKNIDCNKLYISDLEKLKKSI